MRMYKNNMYETSPRHKQNILIIQPYNMYGGLRGWYIIPPAETTQRNATISLRDQTFVNFNGCLLLKLKNVKCDDKQ